MPYVLVGSLALTGCAQSPQTDLVSCPSSVGVDEVGEQTKGDAQDMDALSGAEKYALELAGLNELTAQRCAEEAGFVWRVAGRDGESFFVTLDYNPRRVNAIIVEELVTEATVG